MEDLKLEKVSPTLSVYQKKGVFCYGTDAVLLVKYVLSFYKTLNNKNMCDLCSGTGIIPLMLCDATQSLFTNGVEINKDACEIAVMSANVSSYGERYKQYNLDIKDIKNSFSPECFDFITCNPPYMTKTSGYMCDEDYKTIARHEILCSIDDVFKAAFYLLRTGGNIFIVYRTDRLSSLFKAASDNRFEIKDIKFVLPGDNLPSSSKLVLCRAMKDAAEGLKLEVATTDSILNFTE